MEIPTQEDYLNLMKKFDQLKEDFETFKEKVSQSFVAQRYINQKQAVAYTGKSAKTINDWVIRKGLRQIIVEEKSNPVYDVKDLDAFMEKYKIKE